MLHGLYHAFIPFEAYERLTNGKWGTGGCRCARRVPRVLEFDLADDVQNRHLKVDLDVPLLVFSVKAGFIKNSLHCF
jgi:hypothetical protein